MTTVSVAGSAGVSAAFGLAQVYDYYLERHGRNSLDGAGGGYIGSLFEKVLLNSFGAGGTFSRIFPEIPLEGHADLVSAGAQRLVQNANEAVSAAREHQ